MNGPGINAPKARVRATLLFRNEALLAARGRLGLTQKQLAQFADVGAHVIAALEAFRWPRTGWGPSASVLSEPVVRGIVERVAELLEIEPEEVLPSTVVVPEGVGFDRAVVREVDSRALKEFQDRLSPRLVTRDAGELCELRDSLDLAIQTAREDPARIRAIDAFLLRAKGERTLVELGRELGVSPECARSLAETGRRAVGDALLELDRGEMGKNRRIS